MLQTAGVLDFMGGFVFSARKTTATKAKASAHTAAVYVTPTAGFSSVGLSAFGSF